MPTRKVPDSYPTLVRCLGMALDTYNVTLAAERAIGADLFAKLQGPTALLPQILAGKAALDAALGSQGPATDEMDRQTDRLRMFVSHFHQALDNGIARGAFAAGARTYYGRELHATAIPDLRAQRQVHDEAQNILSGEAARTAAEAGDHVPMSNPAAAEVAAAFEAFEDARTASATALATTNKKQEALQELVALGIELARDLFDTVEFYYRKDPDPASRRAKCRPWGVAYVYGPDETAPVPDQADITNIATPGPGQVHFHYSALNASTYDVLHKGPTQTEFTKVADAVEATVYQASGLAVGAHEFKVVGRNAAGEGKASEVAVVQVN